MLVPILGGPQAGKRVAIEPPLPKKIHIPVADVGGYGQVTYTLGWGAMVDCCGLMEPVYIWLPDKPAMSVPPAEIVPPHHPNCPCTLDLDLKFKLIDFNPDFLTDNLDVTEVDDEDEEIDKLFQ